MSLNVGNIGEDGGGVSKYILMRYDIYADDRCRRGVGGEGEVGGGSCEEILGLTGG